MKPTDSHRLSTMREEALAYADSLFNLGFHLTGNHADSEDLLQETYARAFAERAGFVPGTNMKAWLCRILRNAHIDWGRKRGRAPVMLALELADDEPPTVERVPFGRVSERDLTEAFALLTDEQKAVVLFDLEGLTEAEIADALACAPGTVKSRLARARATLRRHLNDYAQEARNR